MTTAASRHLPAQQQQNVDDHPKEGLSSWWARFKSRPHNKKEELDNKGIFGVPLHQSIQYANVAISLYNDQGQPFIYGYIPIVVAKCGLFLKEHATEIEGIFRLSGSAKRIKELQEVFDLPPKYGKQHEWHTYTVHDAANVLRRYLNHLPDPIIPTDWYDSVREPIRDAWPLERAIPRMQQLVSSLPPVNRQLLLYILDLLAVFASKAELNRMTSENLSAIFQPGVLSHPRDDMAPQEYHLSQKVLVFLIDNQAHFLLDMCPPTGPTGLMGIQQPATDANAAGASGRPPTKRGHLLRRKTLNAPRRSFSLRTPKSDEGSITGLSRTSTPASAGDGRLPPMPSPNLTQGMTVSRSNTMPSKRHPPNATTAGAGPGQQQRHMDGPRYVSAPLPNRAPAQPSVNALASTEKNAPSALPLIPSGASLKSPGSLRTSLRLQAEEPVAKTHAVSSHAPPHPLSEGRRSRRSSQTSSLRGDGEFSILSGRRLGNPSTESVLAMDAASASISGSAALPIARARDSLGAQFSSSSLGRTSQTSGGKSSVEPPLTGSSAGTQPKHSSSPGKFSNFFKRRTRLGKEEMLSPSSESGPSRRNLDD